MEQLTTLAATITTIVEVVKQILKPYTQGLPPAAYSAIVQLVAMGIGIAGAFAMGIDMLVIIGKSDVVTLQGVIVAGILDSFGNQFLHYFLDGAQALAAQSKAKQNGQ